MVISNFVNFLTHDYFKVFVKKKLSTSVTFYLIDLKLIFSGRLFSWQQLFFYLAATGVLKL